MPTWKYNRSKPVIGIAGGIGSGKSTVSNIFVSFGCAVIDSDALAREILESPDVKTALRAWLGNDIFNADNSVNRKAVAARVFTDPAQIEKLNHLIHPRVIKRRDQLMPAFLADPKIPAIIWDTPLLFEVGQDRECDVIVFVNVPREQRLARVFTKRGWDDAELTRREKLQFPLDKKANVADYCIDNSGDEPSTLRQAQQVFSQILALDTKKS